jgi:hypothetical protein
MINGLVLGGRLTVRLRTLDPPIGVRIPASQPFEISELGNGLSDPVQDVPYIVRVTRDVYKR